MVLPLTNTEISREDKRMAISRASGLDKYGLNTVQYFFFFFSLLPQAGHGLLILKVSRSHTTTHHSRKDSSGLVISSLHRPLPDNTQHPQETNIHAPGDIRTQDLIRRSAADLRLRPRGYWDRHSPVLPTENIRIHYYYYYC
jgi:hypothetical protein